MIEIRLLLLIMPKSIVPGDSEPVILSRDEGLQSLFDSKKPSTLHGQTTQNEGTFPRFLLVSTLPMGTRQVAPCSAENANPSLNGACVW